MNAEIRYGKHDVSFYRTHPVRGLLGGRVSIDVFGDNFMPAYTEGDNRMVVATDTMKNFVYAMALEYQGASHEGFTAFLGRRFLETYPQIQSLRLVLLETPFRQHSQKLLSSLADDFGTVVMEIGRDGIRSLICGRRNLRLIKLTGSAFKDFARDAYTTLPDVSDRPLFIYLDVHWRYRRIGDAIDDGPARIASEAVRDSVIATFDDFISMSIQHLVHEMATRLLAEFAGIAEVSFEAQNRLWDTSKVSEHDRNTKVFSDPKPAHGVIGLTLKRDA